MELEMKLTGDDNTKICGWCFYLLLSYVKTYYNVKILERKWQHYVE